MRDPAGPPERQGDEHVLPLRGPEHWTGDRSCWCSPDIEDVTDQWGEVLGSIVVHRAPTDNSRFD